MKRFLTLLPLLALLLVLPASASAHAVLESSSPERGAQLESSPAEVTFEFNEPVEGSFGAVRVFDTDGEEVQEGEMLRPGGSSEAVGVALPSGLPDGTYTATYRVVSADAHPISGGLVFTVGEGGAASGKTISELIALSDVGPVTEAGFWFDRWIGYVALALGIGLVAFLLFVWAPLLAAKRSLLEPRIGDFTSRFRLVAGVAVVAGLLASLVAIPLQGATAAGTDLWSAFTPGVFGDVIDTRFGSVMVLRIALWAALIPFVLFGPSLIARGSNGTKGGRPSAAAWLLALPAVALAVTPALAGHASTQDPVWLLLPSDVLHVAAMAVWSGGLAALILLLPAVTRGIPDEGPRTNVLTDALLRFSALALVAVIVIAVTGTVQAIVEVNSFPALVDTAFGRAVLIKIILFAVLIWFGAKNRRRIIPALVARRETGQGPGRPGVLARNNIRIEVLLVTTVLAVTAALVSYPPPTAAVSGPVSGAVSAGEDRLEYTIDPARVGSNEVHVYLFDDTTGAPVEVQNLEMSFSLPDSEIAPIKTDVRKAGPGHYVAPSAMLAVKGDWLASAAVRFSRFEEELAEFEVPVR